MTKKQLFEMLKNVPDDATILVGNLGYYTGEFYFEPLTCYVHNPDNTVELYSTASCPTGRDFSGDTDND